MHIHSLGKDGIAVEIKSVSMSDRFGTKKKSHTYFHRES